MGSLGDERQVYNGATDDIDKIHAALGDCSSIIEVVVEEREWVFAMMGFGGVQRGLVMGYKPSGKRVNWTGWALFMLRGQRVQDLSVLRDLKGVEDQIDRNDS